MSSKDQLPLVALVGRPNVGKSSLFNRLLRKRQAIIDDTPGVTRDRHYAKVEWQGRSFILIDTGGIEPLPVEGEGKGKAFPHEADLTARAEVVGGIQDQTAQAVEEADLIVFMLDGREGLAGEDFRVADIMRRAGKPVFFVVNKVDGPEIEDELVPQFYELGADQLWPVSAAHGYGVETFMESLLDGFPEQEDVAADVPMGAISVACIGRPNVGKSSLVNRLLGEERMVVSDVPGTTRDSVDSILTIKGQDYLLIDTAGIRRRGKIQQKLEKFSVLRALSSLEKCDIALFLIDAAEGITEQDTKIIGYTVERGRACLVLINKWDLIKADSKRQKWILDEVDRATRFIGYAPTLTISALTGAGTSKIFPTVDKVYKQFSLEFTTNRLNRILQKAVDEHTPSLHKGKRLKFYYATQVGTRPPTFIVFVNYPKGVHFSYHRFLVNRFREELGLDRTPIRLILKERQRKKYG